MPLKTISSPGLYFQDTDMTQSSASDDCILITAPYVTLINRARLVGAGGPNSTNSGIRVAAGAAACTILNHGGSIRGFGYGLKTDGAYLTRIEGLFVQDGWFRGIKLEGDGAFIADCDIRDIHGAMWTPYAYCMGIEVSGMSANGGVAKVLRNCVQNVHGTNSGGNTGESVGISISDKEAGAIVKDNVVQNDYKPGLPFGGGASIGVWIGGASNVIASHNLIKTWDQGLISSSPPTVGHGENFYVDCTTDWTIGGPSTPGSED